MSAVSAETCSAACVDAGFIYSGQHDGNVCSKFNSVQYLSFLLILCCNLACDNQLLSTSTLVDNSICSFICAPSILESCGGPNGATVVFLHENITPVQAILNTLNGPAVDITRALDLLFPSSPAATTGQVCFRRVNYFLISALFLYSKSYLHYQI